MAIPHAVNLAADDPYAGAEKVATRPPVFTAEPVVEAVAAATMAVVVVATLAEH